jgi:hypothetical protein
MNNRGRQWRRGADSHKNSRPYLHAECKATQELSLTTTAQIWLAQGMSHSKSDDSVESLCDQDESATRSTRIGILEKLTRKPSFFLFSPRGSRERCAGAFMGG